MRRLHRQLVVICLAVLLAFCADVFAQKTVHVKGYTRKDGTVVKPYDRRAPGTKGTTTTTAPSPVATSPTSQRPTAPVDPNLIVYLPEGGVVFHQKDCELMGGRNPRPVRYADLPAGAEECTKCRPLAAAAMAQAQRTAADNGETIVYITKSGKKYHADGCRSLSKTRIPIKLKDAVAKGFTACSLCNPPALKAGQEAGAAQQATVPPAQAATQAAKSEATKDNGDITVYITLTGKKYHSPGCRSLAKSSIPIKLRDAVARGYGPCSLCNPPTLTTK